MTSMDFARDQGRKNAEARAAYHRCHLNPSARVDHPVEQGRRRRQGDDIDTSTHASLAAMSTDDVSSMGETQTTRTTAGSRQPEKRRKDDCSESRCTVTSEESVSRRRRCRSLAPDQHRWLDRIDRKAATSDAPIRPNRTDDDGFVVPEATVLPTFQRSVSHTLPRPGSGNDCSYSSFQDAFQAAREIARCQSMSLPPVRPTRTRDDSSPDLMKDDSNRDLMKGDSKPDHSQDTEKDEIDSDMFARLLKGQRMDAQFPSATRPRGRSDADVYMQEKCNMIPSGALRRFNSVASPRGNATNCIRSSGCPHNSCHQMRDNCPHAISPKPPAKPFRTFDDSCEDGVGEKPQAAVGVTLPLTPIDDKEVVGPGSGDGAAGDQRLEYGMNSSSHMDLEKADVGVVLFEARHGVQQETLGDGVGIEVSIQASVKEYDPYLFARLLSGEPCSLADANDSPSNAMATQDSGEQSQLLPPLLARVSSSSTKPVTSALPGYNRFDNSAPCAMPEHMEGAMKSSHPPMRPRRSYDEGMIRYDVALSLATTTAMAREADADETEADEAEAGADSDALEEPVKRRICIVGGKRRYCRQSRRSTLSLAFELPPSEACNTTSALNREPIDSALLALTQVYNPLRRDEIEERDDYVHLEPEEKGDGSYLQILPVRRHRLLRRFTMPANGGENLMTLSPRTKKRRIVGRSLSCRSSEDGVTPAA